MGKYGKITCPDCGDVVEKTSPNLKRCKSCALKSHGETKSGFAEKICTECNSVFKPSGSTQLVCSGCRHEYRAKKNKNHLSRIRREAGKTPVGTALVCASCGDDFVYASGPQSRCQECQRKFEISKIHEWLASDKERLGRYIKKSKDNFIFGGNRQAAIDRDKHTCQHCGSNDKLHVHHIDGNGTTQPRDTRNNSLDNLMTLCGSCHMKEHVRLRHSNCAPQRYRPETPSP